MSADVQPGYYESLCQNAGFALIGTDDQLRIRVWNRMAERIFGARPETMIGMPVLRVFPESARAEAQKALDAAFYDGRPGDLEFKVQETDARRLVLAAVISPISAPDGRRLGVSVGLRDITQRRELSRQLAQSRRMASLGALAGGVAQHFNNILGGVITRIDFVLSSMYEDDPHRADLQRIAEAVGNAVRISGQLRTFAEGDHDPGYLRDLRTVVDEFVAQLQQKLAGSSVRLNLQLEPIPPTQVESRRLLAVLDSISKNAIEAMNGNGELTIGLKSWNGEAVLSIADTGCGIAEENLERLFEPFFTTKGVLGGGAGKNTGLSLCVVHSFVDDMHGHIDVESTVGRGTRFYVRLPLGADAEAPTSQRPANVNQAFPAPLPTDRDNSSG